MTATFTSTPFVIPPGRTDRAGPHQLSSRRRQSVGEFAAVFAVRISAVDISARDAARMNDWIRRVDRYRTTSLATKRGRIGNGPVGRFDNTASSVFTLPPVYL